MDIKTIIRKVLGKMTVQEPENIDSAIDALQKIRTVGPARWPRPAQATPTVLQNSTSGIHPAGLQGYLGSMPPGTTLSAAAATGANSTISNSYPFSTSYTSSQYIAASTYNSTISAPNTSAAMVFYGSSNKEIVRLNPDGSVTWADGINVPEASQAFERSLRLGAERSAGITYGVKQRIRDAVFEELIDMAKTKGTLSVDDLTYLHQAAKIMDKLKGIKE